MKLKSRIMHKAQKNHRVTGRERGVNRAISKLRYAVERTFGSMTDGSVPMWRGMWTGKDRKHSINYRC